MPLIPVHVLEKPDAIVDPKDATKKTPGPVKYPENERDCFLVGANGTFRQKDNPFFFMRTKVEKIPVLATIEEDIRIRVYKLPLELFRNVESFFAMINDKYKGEAVVLLTWHPIKKRWAVKIPQQQTRGMSVKYEANKGKMLAMYQEDAAKEWKYVHYEAENVLPKELEGYEDFGTIHSHCDATAFHSGTDDADEFNWDGLHITVGKVSSASRDYAARWILNGKAVKAEIRGVVDFPLDVKLPEIWMDQVTERASTVVHVPSSQSHLYPYPSQSNDLQKHHSYYGGGTTTTPSSRGGKEDYRPPTEFGPSTTAERAQASPTGALATRRKELLSPPKVGEAGYELFKLLSKKMTELNAHEARIVDAIETNPWMVDDLEDNGVVLELLRDEDALNTFLEAGGMGGDDEGETVHEGNLSDIVILQDTAKRMQKKRKEPLVKGKDEKKAVAETKNDKEACAPCSKAPGP